MIWLLKTQFVFLKRKRVHTQCSLQNESTAKDLQSFYGRWEVTPHIDPQGLPLPCRPSPPLPWWSPGRRSGGGGGRPQGRSPSPPTLGNTPSPFAEGTAFTFTFWGFCWRFYPKLTTIHTHWHTAGGVNHTGQQPARQEWSGLRVLLGVTLTLGSPC